MGKRPCSVCRRWYTPHPRTRKTQRTCGREECRRERRRRTQAKYREEHADYWVERRLREQSARAAKGESEARDGPVVRPPPRSMRQVPWEMAQDAFGAEGAVIIAYLARLAMRSSQDAIRAQVPERMMEFIQVWPEARQDAKGVVGIGQYRPP